MIKDQKKRELYNLLRGLLFKVINKDRGSFLKIRETYDDLLKEIFKKTKFRKGEEGFEWVDVANKLWIIFDYMDMEYNAIKDGDLDKKEKAIMLKNKSLEEIQSKFNFLRRFFEVEENLDLKVRKRRLFEKFEELYEIAKRGDRDSYINLNIDCSEEITKIFGEFKKGEEGFDWDWTKNMIHGILKAQIEGDKESLKHYEESFKKQRMLLLRYIK